MQLQSTRVPYHSTGFFSAIATAYLSGDEALSPFYGYPVSLPGIKEAIARRQQSGTDRQLLVSVLKEQYGSLPLSEKQTIHLNALTQENTFTICTAHQPNIFTGPLYFIYKILHAIKLADRLCTELPGFHFVPVYYMGSEDADLEELGHIYIDGTRYEWNTNQKGAVGRMVVDKALVQLIDQFSGQLLVHPFGEEISSLLKQCYRVGSTIEAATFTLVHELFAHFGLLVLLPDNPALKRAFVPVMQRELLEGFSHVAVQQTVTSFPASYKVQAAGRDLNLFYLTDQSRERIEKNEEGYAIVNTDQQFSQEAMLQELEAFPGRFSPNVILRPVFQEMILPGVVFIGGGGEIAYWLELKKVFEAAGVPYPVLLLRNSFLWIDEKNNLLKQKLGITDTAIFKTETELLNMIVTRDSRKKLDLEQEKSSLAALYDTMKEAAAATDPTLAAHTGSLYQKALHKINALEKKMLRAEKQRFEAAQRQLHKLKAGLFPGNNLQERVENFSLLYAQKGKTLLQQLYDASPCLEQEFVILAEKIKAEV